MIARKPPWNPLYGKTSQGFFAYCNHEHRHSGIGVHAPASVLGFPS